MQIAIGGEWQSCLHMPSSPPCQKHRRQGPCTRRRRTGASCLAQLTPYLGGLRLGWGAVLEEIHASSSASCQLARCRDLAYTTTVAARQNCCLRFRLPPGCKCFVGVTHARSPMSIKVTGIAWHRSRTSFVVAASGHLKPRSLSHLKPLRRAVRPGFLGRRATGTADCGARGGTSSECLQRVLAAAS